MAGNSYEYREIINNKLYLNQSFRMIYNLLFYYDKCYNLHDVTSTIHLVFVGFFKIPSVSYILIHEPRRLIVIMHLILYEF